MVYEGDCPKCGNHFIKEIRTTKDFRKFKGFCSRKCANSRKVSEDQKARTSRTIRETLFLQGTLRCDYGCNQIAQFKINDKYCCCASQNTCPKIIKKNSIALKKAYKEGRHTVWTHYPGAGSNRFKEVKSDSEVFQYGAPTMTAKKRYLKKVELKCQHCGITEWLGRPIHLQVDHVNGDSKDNQFSNLRLLCPNCHSQTDTFCRSEKRTKTNTESGYSAKVTDQEILDTLMRSRSVYEAAKTLNLCVAGYTYERFRRVMLKNSFEFSPENPRRSINGASEEI